MRITRTKIAIKATCKCGGVVAVSMIYGGIEIDSEFTDTVARISNDGGVVEIVDTSAEPVTASSCMCNMNSIKQ